MNRLYSVEAWQACLHSKSLAITNLRRCICFFVRNLHARPYLLPVPPRVAEPLILHSSRVETTTYCRPSNQVNQLHHTRDSLRIRFITTSGPTQFQLPVLRHWPRNQGLDLLACGHI